MVILNIAEKPFEVALVLARVFMLLAFEGGVFDVGGTVLAPILWLCG